MFNAVIFVNYNNFDLCVCVCDSSQPKAIFQKDVESEDKKDDDIEPAWKKKKV